MANIHDDYHVIVFFYTATAPSTVARRATLAAAEREARAYLSDAKGVWIESPDGSRSCVR